MTVPIDSQIADDSDWRANCTYGLTSMLDILTKETTNQLGATGQTIFFWEMEFSKQPQTASLVSSIL